MSSECLQFSLEQFPLDNDAKVAAGLPWGCVVTPMASLAPEQVCSDSVDSVARCEQCFAYISKFAKVYSQKWTCPMCYHSNRFGSNVRYAGSQYLRVPELKHSTIEFTMRDGLDHSSSSSSSPLSNDSAPSSASSSTGSSNSSNAPDMAAMPAYVFLVDLTGSSGNVELVKSALLAAVEGLPDAANVGLAVFSHKLGLFDLRSFVPFVRHIKIPSSSKDVEMALGELMGVDEFLVPLGARKDNVCAALDSLLPVYEDAAATDKCRRGFGPAISAVTDYLARGMQEQGNVRVLCFLSGVPNYGKGAFQLQQTLTKDDKEKGREEKLSSATEDFYKDLGTQAAFAGICIDVYTVRERQEQIGLGSLKFLTLLTGGNLLLYDASSLGLLPQDLFRQLCREQGFRGLLRVRTGKDFEVSSVYGHAVPDSEFPNLFHLAGMVYVCTCVYVCMCAEWCSSVQYHHMLCLIFLSPTGFDARKVVCLDFEFATAEGFRHGRPHDAIVQVAFAYNVLVSGDDGNGDGEEGPEAKARQKQGRGARMVRKLRIFTAVCTPAPSIMDLYAHVSIPVVLSCLTNQVIHISMQQGMNETRLLLQDWLTRFAACYGDVILARATTAWKKNGLRGEQPEPLGREQLQDLLLSRETEMEVPVLSRLVFALLSHPLVASEESIDTDTRVFLQCLYSALEPSYLQKAIYPSMTAYSDTQDEKEARGSPCHLSLSEVQVASQHAELFVMDAFTELFVFQPSRAKDMPFPPPTRTPVAEAIKAIKINTPLMSPRVVHVKEDDEAQRARFVGHLIEDKLGFTFSQFLDTVTASAADVLQQSK
jgi:hypothetical protein